MKENQINDDDWLSSLTKVLHFIAFCGLFLMLRPSDSQVFEILNAVLEWENYSGFRVSMISFTILRNSLFIVGFFIQHIWKMLLLVTYYIHGDVLIKTNILFLKCLDLKSNFLTLLEFFLREFAEIPANTQFRISGKLIANFQYIFLMLNFNLNYINSLNYWN